MISYIYNCLKSCSLSFSVENKWFSIGFPSNPSWGWNKAQPKSNMPLPQKIRPNPPSTKCDGVLCTPLLPPLSLSKARAAAELSVQI